MTIVLVANRAIIAQENNIVKEIISVTDTVARTVFDRPVFDGIVGDGPVVDGPVADRLPPIYHMSDILSRCQKAMDDFPDSIRIFQVLFRQSNIERIEMRLDMMMRLRSRNS